MLERDHVDAVDICSPNGMHAERAPAASLAASARCTSAGSSARGRITSSWCTARTASTRAAVACRRR